MTIAMNFKVTRQNPELISPAKPTPHEFRPLSDLDDQEGLRFHVGGIQFYQKNSFMDRKDPIKIIRDAIAKALVFYYPFAGRLRECGPRKLVVECTAEGIVFTGADADTTLQQFGEILRPPFPNMEELIYDVPGSSTLINAPLFVVQVTRLKCQGFIFAYRFIHTMCDGAGVKQFISAIGEVARGAQAPSIPPVWDRHLLSARCPPCVPFTHREYVSASDSTAAVIAPNVNLVERSFLFDDADISALRRALPPHARGCTKFELVMACIWRCRTFAITPNPKEEVQFSILVNMRKRLHHPLPKGYYGNAVVFPTAVTTAEKLMNNSLDYAVALVKKAKSDATEEYMKSVVDLMALDRPSLMVERSYMVSDHTNGGFEDVDFGWGKAAYGGAATVGIDPAPGLVSFVTPFKNKKEEDGIAVPICLPLNAMDVFAEELEKMKMTAKKYCSISSEVACMIYVN